MKKYQIFSNDDNLATDKFHLYSNFLKDEEGSNERNFEEIKNSRFCEQIIELQNNNYEYILTDILPNNKKLTKLPHIQKLLIEKGVTIKNYCESSINICFFENGFWNQYESILYDNFSPVFVNHKNLEIIKNASYIYITKFDYSFISELLNRININCKLILK